MIVVVGRCQASMKVGYACDWGAMLNAGQRRGDMKIDLSVIESKLEEPIKVRGDDLRVSFLIRGYPHNQSMLVADLRPLFRLVQAISNKFVNFISPIFLMEAVENLI